jgi:hypothetical protein
MPNDCSNQITITCENTQELTKLIETELKCATGIYHKNIFPTKMCPNGIKFEQITAWKPRYLWLESLTTNYPNCWIKNDWHEEGGNAGVWVGNNITGIQSMEWVDLSIEEQYEIFHKYTIDTN